MTTTPAIHNPDELDEVVAEVVAEVVGAGSRQLLPIDDAPSENRQAFRIPGTATGASARARVTVSVR